MDDAMVLYSGKKAKKPYSSAFSSLVIIKSVIMELTWWLWWKTITILCILRSLFLFCICIYKNNQELKNALLFCSVKIWMWQTVRITAYARHWARGCSMRLQTASGPGSSSSTFTIASIWSLRWGNVDRHWIFSCHRSTTATSCWITKDWEAISCLQVMAANVVIPYFRLFFVNNADLVLTLHRVTYLQGALAKYRIKQSNCSL